MQNLERGGRERGLVSPISPSAWSPFGSMRRFMDEVDRLFGAPFGGMSSGLSMLEPMGNWMPQMEVLQREGKLEVRADLPGIKPEDVKINVENDVLTISGERQQKHESTEGGVFHCERSYGTFQRSVALPKGIDANAIEARFEDGVLEITMPMPKEEARGRKIEIKSGGRPGGGGQRS